jgi:antitoxin YefM
MPSISLNYLRTHLDEALALAQAEEVVIACDSGRNMVLVQESDWRAIQETLHLLSSPLNAARLQESLQQVRREYLAESKQP